MHGNVIWTAWGALLVFVAFLIRVSLTIRGRWSAVKDLANGDLPLASEIGRLQVTNPGPSFNVSPTLGHTQSPGIGARQHVVYELDAKTASSSDIPKAMLDLLSPAQREQLLAKFAEAKRASTENGPSPKASKAS
jgi:hypothetical protein